MHTFALERLIMPTGRMLIATDAEHVLRALDREDHEQRMMRLLRQHYGANGRLREVTRGSFGGARRRTRQRRQPIVIVIPCHRVIGANAALTGYGGGLDRKRWLLRHESAATDDCAINPGQQQQSPQLSAQRGERRSARAGHHA